MDRAFWSSFPVVLALLAVASVAGVATAILTGRSAWAPYIVGTLVAIGLLFVALVYARRPLVAGSAPSPPVSPSPDALGDVSEPEDFVDPVEEADRLGTLSVRENSLSEGPPNGPGSDDSSEDAPRASERGSKNL